MVFLPRDQTTLARCEAAFAQITEAEGQTTLLGWREVPTDNTCLGDNGWVAGVQTVRLEWRQETDGRWTMQEIAGSEAVIPAELVLLALGFVHPVHAGMLAQLGVALDAQGNVRANTENYQTSRNNVFAAGDMRRGQSLVVWAIREGRQCARAVDEFLMGGSDLAG